MCSVVSEDFEVGYRCFSCKPGVMKDPVSEAPAFGKDSGRIGADVCAACFPGDRNVYIACVLLKYIIG